MAKIDDPVAVGLALGGTGHAVGTGTAFRYGAVAGGYGWPGYRCHRYSLCICQSHRSRFDIEVKK